MMKIPKRKKIHKKNPHKENPRSESFHRKTMETKQITVDPGMDYEELLKILAPFGKMIRSSEVVAFPTETVYGLGADALDPRGIKKIYEAKGRPVDNPLIVHIHDKRELVPLVKSVPPKAKALMDAFWPGPLTMIFQKTVLVPMEVTAGGSTVAIRMPDHPVAKALIQISRVPLVAPSANRSGKPSPTTAEHVLEDLDGRIHGIIDGGKSMVGLESTVIDMTEPVPVLLRPGGITLGMIEKIIGPIERDFHLEPGHSMDPDSCKDKGIKLRSPGMKYTHYAPRASVVIIKGEGPKVIEHLRRMAKTYGMSKKKVGIITVDEHVKNYEDLPDVRIKSLGGEKDLAMMATNLFTTLRSFDATDVDIIFAEAIEDREVGEAIMNRLTKAAGENIIHVS